jgi:hypothetical protein
MESSRDLPIDINGNIVNIQTINYEDLSIMQLRCYGPYHYLF